MPTPLQPGGPASGPPPERKRRRKRDDPQSSAALEPDDDDGDMSPEEEPRNAPAAPAAPAPAPASAPAPTSPPAAPDAVDLSSRRDSPPLSSDVERFDGKIVYNPDGSAYIIEDPELSEGETSLSDLPKIEPGCIVDSRNSNIVERQLEFPQIASAFYVSRNPSLYGALYGRLAAERARARPDAPVMHSYRVFSFRGGKDAPRPQSPPAECPVSVPVKPILMCFICKLSFGYAKSFVAHAQSDHSLSLLDSERDALSRENASAIIQCVGKDKEALVSFLEPVGAAAPPRASASGSPANVSELSSPSMDKRPENMMTPIDRDSESMLPNGTCDERRPSPPAWRPPRSIADAMIPQHSLISVAHPHTINASVQPRASPNSSPPFQVTPPAFLSGTTIGVCPDHLGGRPSGADCPKCELILNSGRLGGPLAGMHSRNSCKTLKCPKCNWHYKYQETLEIHMKEKHPEAETSCIYCIAGQPHPRLARGETYTCGYKPYRCEVCNYSTTTKGNLSIHMQSDKHLNNMQELQNGGNPGEGTLPPPPQHTPPGVHKPPLPHHSPLGQKPKPTFRCDVCNYETNVARNLRIHMTSEKHTHNMLVLQQNVKHMQTLSALHHRQQSQQQLESLLHFHSGEAPPPNPEAALADMAYNQALMIQLMTGGPGPSPPELGAHLDVGLNPDAMEPPPEPADPEPERTFHCCICNCFSTDSLEALGHHLAQDRTKIREQEILALVAGHYVCKLCTYKTNLKANFQLHCKTDKHLQRLQHVNHVKEGGPRNEWKLKFCGGVGTGNAGVGGVQIRCCSCDYYTNSAHKLQLHAAGSRHEAAALLLRHLRECAARIPRERPRVYRCALCGFGAPHRLPLLQHVRSVKHLQMEQIHQLQRRSEGKDPTPDVAELFQVIPQPSELSSPYDQQENDNKEPVDQKPELTQEQKMMRFLEQHQQQAQQQLQQQIQQQQQSQQGSSERDEERETPGPHACPYCNFSCGSESRLHAHVAASHGDNTRHFICPLCQDAFKERAALERHVMQIHSVNSEGLQRLLLLVDQSHWLNGGTQTSREDGRQGDEEREISSPRSEGSADGETERCSTCNRTFRNVDELCQHQNESGHFELKQTPQGPGYVCWKKGCNRYFDTAHALQNHFREAHARNSIANMSVSEKHVYKYRCNQCSLAFKTVEKLQLHSQYHVIRDATKCVLCGRSFRSVLALQKHVETSHSELSEEELSAFKRSLASNPLLQGGQGTALDAATAELLRKETLRTPEDELGEQDDRDSSATVADESGHNDAENSDDSIIYKDQQFLEDYLNSQAMAEDSYNDPNRKYKCHRCKVAFTRQSYLTAHNKTLLHRKGEKLTYPMEKYLDPNRPFKCDVCKESFTQKNILLVHYNSVSHLHKLKRAMQEQQNNNNPPVSPGAGSAPSNLTLTPKSTSSEEDERKRYKCNICKVAYTQGSTLDIHMRSVLHQTRAGKLQELAAAGHVDLSRPLVEQPDRNDPAKILQDVLSPKNTSPSSTSSGGPRSSPPARPGSPRSPRAGSASCDRCHASFPTGELLDAHRATSCPFGDARAHSPLADADAAALDEMVAKGNPPKRNSQMYKQLLETFGFDLVMQYNENQRRKMQEEREMARAPSPPPPPPEEKPPDGETKSTCQHCNKEFSSVFVLKTHCEEVHKDKVPLEFLEQFAEHFKSEYERKSGAPNSPRAASPAPQEDRSPSPRAETAGNFANENGNGAGEAQAGALLAAQVQEMQAALNMLQLQQQLGQLHPMVAQMLSLGLPLGLNMGALAAMNLQPPLVPLMLPPPPFDTMNFGHDAQMKQQQLLQQQQQQANAAAGQKRARTRITDDQLKILRAHFDINNSPSDEAIAKMAKQSGLATKVIKHWFRNTLFKERQRNKDSPYNFNNPPSTTLNLEEYEKTGEAKVTTLDSSASSDEGKPPPEKKVKIEEPPVNQQEVKSEPNDEPTMEEKYHTYDDRHQEDKSFIFPQVPMQSPAPSLNHSDHHQNISRPQTPTHLSLNSLIQSQLDSIPATSIPQPPHPSMLPPKLNQNFTSPNSVPPNVLPLTPNRSLSPGRVPADFGLSGGNSNGSNSSGSSGKRANRTRFTDYQIKVLQEFFENNAYPKDDDLEYLSKLLGLSPRVIVVWFQNARQKARKVYENQPAAEPPAGATDDANRFQRTPGLNYQCKKCQLVFQRYYELIRHQKTHCFKEEDAKRSAQAQAAAAQVAATLSSEDSNSSTVEHHTPHVPVSPAPPRTPTPAAPNYPVSPAPPTPHTPVTPMAVTPRTEEKDGNFQCDKCNLVFPRFDLWREHQLVHIMNPNLFPTYPPDSPFGILQQHAQLQQLNAQLGNEEARHPLVAAINQQAVKRKFDEYEEVDTGEQPKDKRLRTTILPEQLDYLYQKYQIESNPSRKMLENIAREVGLKKRVVQVWFQNTRARERKGQFRAHAQVINKRCPFCPALFKVKSALESHLSTKHADQCARGEINVDALPDEELSTESTPSFGSQQSDRQQNFSQAGAPMLPPIFPPFHSDMEKFIKQYSEESMKRYVSELQAHAAAQQNGGNNETSENRTEHGKPEIPLDLSKPVDLSRPGSDADERSDTASETMEFYEEDEPTSPLPGQMTPRPPGKRYRTQMSSLQVKIMKSLFSDYKTPTMAECEALGREIGLPKRVVQVWFQNARAKEKKARLAAGLSEVSDVPPPEECRVCDFKYSHKYSVQDHVFTRGHIATVRARLETGVGVGIAGGEDSTMALMQMAARLESNIELHNAFLRPQLAGNGECT
ncbi:hypothetical protein MSG28_005320 [Choristoneura fumiferana]|uniref:Uncharacterized protein n=1 Tax=Choristoneura fumiferana TaxID=7141 RepID=A0ACC0JQP6_CHOFU|nr:hypothetical protein MSG28_005320 [Choristoneura fumiferana]